mgnify:CR=1 FL=1
MRDTVKRTFEKDPQGQYLLDGMEELTMNGDAYVSSDLGISPAQVQRNCSSFALPYFVFSVSRYMLPVWQILLCLLYNISGPGILA